MSRLLVITRPSLTPGFQLAGVEAFAVEEAAEAQQLIAGWIEAQERGLLVIDEGLMSEFDLAFQRRLDAAEALPHISLPTGELAGLGPSRRRRIAEMIRKAVGFHITFGGEQA